MNLHLRRATVGTLHLLMATGEIDLATVPKLASALGRLVGDHPAVVVAVDLDGVSACDDVGFGILLGAAARAREAGGDLIIVCSDLRLVTRFVATRLDRAITIVGRVADIAQPALPGD